MRSYQTIYIDFPHQIQYLFENRLSDKFYFCNFTHVILCFMQKPNYNIEENLRGVPFLLLF